MQSPGLPHADFEELIGTEMTCKVLEADEEKDRLVLSNRKNAFGTRKINHNVRLPAHLRSCFCGASRCS